MVVGNVVLLYEYIYMHIFQRLVRSCAVYFFYSLKLKKYTKEKNICWNWNPANKDILYNKLNNILNVILFLHILNDTDPLIRSVEN